MIRHPLYKRGNMYLSGGMEKAKDLGSAWRLTCSEKLKEMQYFPLDITSLDKAYSAAHGQLYFNTGDEDFLQFKSNLRRQFIYTDIQLIINDSDGLVVLYDESVQKGAGTISECQVAYNHDIPIFLVTDLPHVPAWLRALTTKLFHSFDELYDYLDRLPFGILSKDVYGNHHAGAHYLCSLCGEPFEKKKTHFVSKVSPLYCKSCIDVVKTTYEVHYDRYQFFLEFLVDEAESEVIKNKLGPDTPTAES